ncbi:uncharacterized protein LOC130913681 [Corythoichthys intestinalis]|uniref:uncharacterized protein LOC130913681 n=1 Tax=Corythoichthys intestinalis TaxID=161448 RepID=UPI0025A67E51|nr:uncharacterized protein LOC130913681 [Corythoichthys intestinalis]
MFSLEQDVKQEEGDPQQHPIQQEHQELTFLNTKVEAGDLKHPYVKEEDDNPQPLNIKEEDDPQPLYIMDEESEAKICKSSLPGVFVKSENNLNKPAEWSQLHRDSSSGDNRGGPPDNLLGVISDSYKIEGPWRSNADCGGDEKRSKMTKNLLEIVTFLRGRGVSEETINWIEQQKIDSEVILLMEDAQLAKYLPSYGDRIALFNFCKHQPQSSKRKGLFEKLREKIKHRKENHTGTEESNTSNKTKRPKPKTRKIEIGWIHTEGQLTKQIRAKQGGGTRKISVRSEGGYDEILKQGKSIFFPDGESTKGPERDFVFDIWDFKQNPFPKDFSIEQVYELLKLPILRFYITTHPKSALTEDSDRDPGFAEVPDNELSIDINDKEYLTEMSHDSLPEVLVVCNEALAESSATTENSGGSSQENTTLVIGDPLAFSTNTNYDVRENGPEITSAAAHTVNHDRLIHQPDELPQSPLDIPEMCLFLHYTNSFSEMIRAFSDPEILNKKIKIRRLLPHNSVEMGSGSGVVRDVYSSFWAEFYERCTLGTTWKVPFVRHDFSAATWKSIGRILLKGFQDCQYLPIKLAPPFLEEIFYGAVYSDLKTSFLKFVGSQDQDVLRRAMHEFSSVDENDLLEALDNYECRKKVTASSFSEILKEISHKELVQKPMFVIDCWREIVQPHIHFNSGELNKRYSDLKPTPKKVAEILKFPTEMTQKQSKVAQHLKRYVRELNEEKLGRFLRFCTGSDLLVTAGIQIEFIVLTTFTRRPIGRTCTMILQLPDTYDHFPDFRSEFNSILESNIWVMDIA